MMGPALHHAMLKRVCSLMEEPQLCPDGQEELLALASACEAYEGIMYPMSSKPVRASTSKERRGCISD